MALDKPLKLSFLATDTTQSDKPKADPQVELEQVRKEAEKEFKRAEAHKKDLEATRKRLAETEARLKEQQAENKRLQAENQETQRRQDLLVAELEKAEAQAELIKEMLLNEDQQQRLENTKKEA